MSSRSRFGRSVGEVGAATQRRSVFIRGEVRERTGAYYWYYQERGTKFVDETEFIKEGTEKMFSRVARTIFRTFDNGLRRELL